MNFKELSSTVKALIMFITTFIICNAMITMFHDKPAAGLFMLIETIVFSMIIVFMIDTIAHSHDAHEHELYEQILNYYKHDGSGTSNENMNDYSSEMIDYHSDNN